MAVTHGMNPDEVEALGQRLQNIADRVRSEIVNEINSMVNSTTWIGEDASTFKDQWWPEHRTSLNAVAEQLHGFGQSALNNATEQREVSRPR